MIGSFMRSGWNARVVHLAECPCCNRFTQWIGWAIPWEWANEQSALQVRTRMWQKGLRPCPLCRPMNRLLPREAQK